MSLNREYDLANLLISAGLSVHIYHEINKKLNTTTEDFNRKNIELEQRIKKLEEDNQELREMIMCMPGIGSEFMKAKEEFETLNEKI